MSRLITAIVGNPAVLIWFILGAFGFGIASGGGVAWKVQGYRLDAAKAKYSAFVAPVKAMGEEAKKEVAAKEKFDKLNKEQSDLENTRTHHDVSATVSRMRHANSGQSVLPAAPTASSRPDIACYDRAESERAFGVFLAEARAIADEGTANTIDLNTAKGWAGHLSLTMTVGEIVP